MYRICRHRAFYSVYFGDVCLTEPMYKLQTERWIFMELKLCEDSRLEKYV